MFGAGASSAPVQHAVRGCARGYGHRPGATIFARAIISSIAKSFRQEIDGSAVYGTRQRARQAIRHSVRQRGDDTSGVSHLLVVSPTNDRVLVGVQRDRTRDDSIVTSLDTSTAISRPDRARLLSRLRGRARFAQANLLTAEWRRDDAVGRAPRDAQQDALGPVRAPVASHRRPCASAITGSPPIPSPSTCASSRADTLGGESCFRAEGSASAEALIPRSGADSSGFT